MALFSWNDSYSVKVTELDNQHKKLIDIINELHQAMLDKKAKDALEKIIGELMNYTINHFSFEEKYFAQYSFPGEAAHKKEHKNFLDKVTQFGKDFDEGKLMLSMEILNFLKEWLVNHIKGTDQNYSDFFNEKGLI